MATSVHSRPASLHWVNTLDQKLPESCREEKSIVDTDSKPDHDGKSGSGTSKSQ